MTLHYSVPQEAQRVLIDGIINNPLHKHAPVELKEAAKHISYEGTASPVIPINWRFAESISAIKGFQGAMLNVLLKKKYGQEYQNIVINTDHAQLFFMSTLLPVIDPEGEKISIFTNAAKLTRFFPNRDLYPAHDKYRICATNIYRTKDDRFYHIHGSMNPEPCQDALGLPHNVDPLPEPWDDACKPYEEKVGHLEAKKLDVLMNDEYRQAGTIAWSTEEYLNSEHGKANSHVGLYEVHHIPNPSQGPSWWEMPQNDEASPRRPLYGLKVVDITRVIASPAITRELAELGASVMRITAPHITDMSSLHCDLNWGKWNASLDLRKEEDRGTLKDLIKEADVVLDGYRPRVMEKWGFGKDDILKMCAEREKGIIYARENCYGWQGPWWHRSGWQQISDACCGVSLEFGRAMGNDEAVTPVFPNSDYCTGAAGATGILQALVERGEKGGSYVVDIALNYYSQWLVNSCGVYPTAVWESVWNKYDRFVMRHNWNMMRSLPFFMSFLKQNATDVLFRPEFFENRHSGVLNVDITSVKPILKFPSGLVELKYNVGTRGNGIDKPKWPKDLLTEIVD